MAEKPLAPWMTSPWGWESRDILELADEVGGVKLQLNARTSHREVCFQQNRLYSDR